MSKVVKIGIANTKGSQILNVNKIKALKGKGSCCFVAGTLVLTINGHAAIEEIQVGDLVWSKNTETGEQAFKPVEELIRRHDREIYELQVDTILGERLAIETTDDHPFFTPPVGWKATIDLLPGDFVETDGYGLVTVVSVENQYRVAPTYNFSVADFHTYYVTDRNLLVHNENCDRDVASGEAYGHKDNTGLKKQLKSEEQLADINNGGGVPTHGAGAPRKLDVAGRLEKQYGGNASDWQKVSSDAYKSTDGGHVEIHAYRNIKTGQVVEPKSIVNPQVKGSQ